MVQVVLAVVGIYLVIRQVYLLRKQIGEEHDWNRRHATHELLTEIILGKFMEVRRKLEIEMGMDIFNKNQTYSSVQPRLNADQKAAVRDLLNYLEEMCIAIKHSIIDEDIAYDNASYVLLAYDRWARSYIEERQRIAGPLSFAEIQLTALRWERRRKEEQEKMVMPGKSKLGT